MSYRLDQLTCGGAETKFVQTTYTPGSKRFEPNNTRALSFADNRGWRDASTLLDVRSGFWHVMLEEQSAYLTTFNTPFGRERWKHFPFRICSALQLLNCSSKICINSSDCWASVRTTLQLSVLGSVHLMLIAVMMQMSLLSSGDARTGV